MGDTATVVKMENIKYKDMKMRERERKSSKQLTTTIDFEMRVLYPIHTYPLYIHCDSGVPDFLIVLWRQKASACVFATLFLEHTSNSFFHSLSGSA